MSGRDCAERRRTARATLTLNGGSSTVKCGLFTFEAEPREIARDSFENPGGDSFDYVRQWVHARALECDLVAVGHRVVHGGDVFLQPQILTPEATARLRTLVPFAPNHLPQEIALIEAAAAALPNAMQYACFDTAFHASMPEVARRLPLPSDLTARGLRKYGFHGLSYAFLVEELRRLSGSESEGRVVLAHLGNGSSLAAVYEGRSIDTTMGLTPIGGVMMGTRTGDLDPGVVTHLARTTTVSADALEDVFSRASGLLGVSGVTSDMKTLLDREQDDEACRLAVAMYVYSTAKAAAALCAALGGLDTLVFSGGIGEHAPSIRSRILRRLAWIGAQVDATANDANAAVISVPSSRVTVRVIPTDEELVIARAAYRLAQSGHDDAD